MTTIPIYFNIIDLFKEDEKESIEEEYSCSICCELVYDNIDKSQNQKQCLQGHTGCENCWLKIIKLGTKEKPASCMICREPILSIESLSRSRFIETSFKNKKVSCPYSFLENIKLNKVDNGLVKDEINGCKEYIKIENLKEHLENCKYRFVKCDKSDNCQVTLRYKDYVEENHEKECKHNIKECESCLSGIKLDGTEENHIEICPSKIIECSQCNGEIKRYEINQHIKDECKDTIVQCKYKKFGCEDEVKRSELQLHLDNVNHTHFLEKMIENQYQDLNKYRNEIIEYKDQLDSCKNEIKGYKEDLQNLNNNYNILLSKFDMVNLRLRSIEEFEVSYNNQWIIKDFISRSNKRSSIKSDNIIINQYVFYLQTSKKSNDGIDYYGVYLHYHKNNNNSNNIKIRFSTTLINSLNQDRNENHSQLEEEFEIGVGIGHGWNSNIFTKENGIVFNDNSIRIIFNIQIYKSSFIS